MLTSDDLNKIENLVDKVVTKRISSSEKKLIDRMIRGQNLVISYFDESYLSLKSRVDRIEKKIGLSSNS